MVYCSIQLKEVIIKSLSHYLIAFAFNLIHLSLLKLKRDLVTEGSGFCLSRLFIGSVKLSSYKDTLVSMNRRIIHRSWGTVSGSERLETSSKQ